MIPEKHNIADMEMARRFVLPPVDVLMKSSHAIYRGHWGKMCHSSKLDIF